MSNEKKSRSEISILVVEDDETTIKLLEYLLPKKFQILKFTIVKDGCPAIELCKNEDFDLVLMDIVLPKINGIEAMKEIKLQKPTMIIVAYTALSEEVDRAKGSGFDDIVLKPVTFELFDDIFKKFIPGY